MEKLSACLKDATQDCSVEVPKGFQVEKEQLPSFSGLSVGGIGDTVRLLCNDGENSSFLKTFISLLNYIEIFQCIETLLELNIYIYIYIYIYV